MRTLFLDPGALRSELALAGQHAVPMRLGGHAENWTEVATVFARSSRSRRPARSAPDQTLETVTHRMTIGQRDGVASGMRFVKQGRIFEIVTVHDPDEPGAISSAAQGRVGCEAGDETDA